MTESGNNILLMNNLTVGYSNKKRESFSLPSLNLSLKSGELTGLIGVNGSGKSTLLRSIAGLQPLISGALFINGVDINELSKNEKARKISFVSTELLNVNNIRIYDLVALGRFPYTDWFGNLTEKDREKVSVAIDKVGLDKIKWKFFSELSDGQKQRVMIARALAQDTEVIILDEPTAFLDMSTKYEIVSLLHDIAKNENKSILFSVHDINIALREADVLWLIDKDQVYFGAPEDLVINGDLGRMFSSKKLEFNLNTGEIITPGIGYKEICIIGEGVEKVWTIKALERLNFKIKCNKDSVVTVHVLYYDDNLRWNVDFKGENYKCNSIYDLSLYLRKFKI